MRLLTALFIILTVTARAQTTGADTVTTHIQQLLTPGKYLVHYIRPDPNKGLTPEQLALQAKVVKAFMQNAAWMRDSLQSISDPQAMMDALRQKSGLTEEEWKEYQTIAEASGKGFSISGEDQLDIIVQGKQISFHGTGSAEALDSVLVDLETNTVLYRQRRIPFGKIRHSNGANTPFQSPNISYEYELENTSMTDPNDTKSMHMENYQFGVVQFTETGKIAITLLAVKVNGSMMLPGANIALLMLLD